MSNNKILKFPNDQDPEKKVDDNLLGAVEDTLKKIAEQNSTADAESEMTEEERKAFDEEAERVLQGQLPKTITIEVGINGQQSKLKISAKDASGKECDLTMNDVNVALATVEVNNFTHCVNYGVMKNQSAEDILMAYSVQESNRMEMVNQTVINYVMSMVARNPDIKIYGDILKVMNRNMEMNHKMMEEIVERTESGIILPNKNGKNILQ